MVATKENGQTKIDMLEQDIKSLEAKAAGMNKFERAEINKEIELKRSQIERLQKQVNTADAELKDIDAAQKLKTRIEETSKLKTINDNNATSTKGMTLDKWENKIYGGKLNRTKEGYEEAIIAKDKLIKEQEILLDKIAKGTATPEEIDYISSGRMAKQIMQKDRAIRAIEKTMDKSYSATEAIESDRIFSAKNSIVDGSTTLMQITKESALHTNPNHVYRVTGNNQLNDIINTGYVRPRGTKAKGSGALNQVYWTRGHEKVNYDLPVGLSGKVVLEVPIEKISDGQIGAISLDDLSGIWKYDKKTGKNINIIDQVRKLYNSK